LLFIDLTENDKRHHDSRRDKTVDGLVSDRKGRYDEADEKRGKVKTDE